MCRREGSLKKERERKKKKKKGEVQPVDMNLHNAMLDE
jgi:hypothetical protein